MNILGRQVGAFETKCGRSKRSQKVRMHFTRSRVLKLYKNKIDELELCKVNKSSNYQDSNGLIFTLGQFSLPFIDPYIGNREKGGGGWYRGSVSIT